MLMASMRRAIAASLVVVLVAATAGAIWWWSGPSAEERQVVYTVPPGTAALLARGEQVTVLPQTINLTLGRHDILIIRNDDVEPVQVGPFKIDPGQSFTQQYYNRGTYELVCSIHQGQRMRIVVE